MCKTVIGNCTGRYRNSYRTIGTQLRLRNCIQIPGLCYYVDYLKTRINIALNNELLCIFRRIIFNFSIMINKRFKVSHVENRVRSYILDDWKVYLNEPVRE